MVQSAMMPFLARRTFHLVIALVLLSLLTFALLHLAPGGPAQALLGPDQVSLEQRAAVEARLGLDKPIHTQLWVWGKAVLSGDLGNSYFYRQPALTVVMSRLPATLILGGLAGAVAIAVGLPAGIAAAYRPGGWLDRLTRSAGVLLITVPSFWLGILLIYFFSVQAGWFPSSGTGRSDPDAWMPNVRNLILPALTMALPTAATFMLYTRNAVVEAMRHDAIRTVRGMGHPERHVLHIHAFRMAIAPVLMQIGLYLPHLVEGSIVVESVFSWPGLGQLTMASVGRRDYPILLTLTILLGVSTIISSTITDVIHARVDPRIDLQ